MKKQFGALVLAAALLLGGCQTGGTSTGSETAKGRFQAGSYTVKGPGYSGDIELEVRFSADKLEEIKVKKHEETAEIGGPAMERLATTIQDQQSTQVDGVTGATATSDAFKKLVNEAIEKAGANPADLKPLHQEKKDAQQFETDVVVVGGGGAGLSAAISAAQEGAKVILIEKTGALGGNTVRAGGPYNAVDPKRQAALPAADEASMEKIKMLTTVEAKNDRHKELQDELKKDIEAYEAGDKASLFDSKALHKLQTYDGGDYIGKLEFIEKLVDESLETSEWMAKNGVEWKDQITTVPGGLWPRAHLPKNSAGGDYIKAGSAEAEKLGVQILLNAPAQELLVEEGKVVGIKGQLDGADLQIKAKAVILATGGFAANVQMRMKYVPGLVESLPTTNSPAITGDGIAMAEAVHAQLTGMEYIQSLPLGNSATGGLNAWVGGAGVEYYYQINKAGKRFMAEDGRRDYMTNALLEQEDQLSYVITSAEDHLEVNDKMKTIWGDDINQLVQEKVIFRGETIEELAQNMGIDPKVLKETHDRFNQFVAAGKDEDFGRTLFGKPLVTGPFFASPRVPTVHHTMGGLAITLQGEVLNEENKVIPGLFAAGEVTGGIHGGNRLGGNALVDIHVFGRTAGKTAATSIH